MEFVHNLEEMIELVGGGESFKLLGIRGSLAGAARLLLQTNDALTYEGLKAVLIREFSDQLVCERANRSRTKSRCIILCFICNT